MTTHEEILLNEDQIQPGKYASGDASMWYLDNGASNHMTGVKSHFKDINERDEYVLEMGRHLNFDNINKMTRKNLVDGIPRINHAKQVCDACLLGKHSRTTFLNQAKFRSKNPLDLVYGDLYGPISPATHPDKKFILLQNIEMEMRMKVRMLRTDRGGEFTSNEFTKYCKENRIARQLTAPYSPQQNGVVERRNRTVLSTTRSMMKAMELPLTFWAEAVRHAIYILNRVPTRALEDETLYEALYNRKPNLENLRIFRCTAYAKITTPHLKKLDDRRIPMIYLGVEERSKSCRLYDPITKKKHVSRDVNFMETKPWDWNKGEEDRSTQDTFWTSFMVEGVDNENTTPVNIEINDNIDDTYQEPDPINDPNSPITPSTYTYNPHSDEEVKATTSSIENLEKGFDHVPVRGFKKLTDIYHNTLEFETNTLLLTEEEPRNYKEASTDKKWIEAMEIELDSINKNNTWILTTLPDRNSSVNISISSISWMASTPLRCKISILHGDLKEEVYVAQPEGFVQQGNSGKVYKLIKALYGLRQEPRAWNVKLDQTLKSLDFKKCERKPRKGQNRIKTKQKGKRVEAGKSLKQLQLKEEEKPKKTKK
nr:zinc finger, CCHC-type [Tanacetum cinerariifolium]